MSKQEIMLQHVENWKQSGLTQSAYCKNQNIKVYTLSYWVKISNKQESTPLDSSFITIEKQANIASSKYEIVYPNGVILRINTSNVAELSTLLKLV